MVREEQLERVISVGNEHTPSTPLARLRELRSGKHAHAGIKPPVLLQKTVSLEELNRRRNEAHIARVVAVLGEETLRSFLELLSLRGDMPFAAELLRLGPRTAPLETLLNPLAEPYLEMTARRRKNGFQLVVAYGSSDPRPRHQFLLSREGKGVRIVNERLLLLLR